MSQPELGLTRDGLGGALFQDSEGYLGDPSVVGMVVTTFVWQVLDAFKAFQRREKTRDEAMATIENLAKKAGGALVGEVPGYVPAEVSPAPLRGRIRAQDAIPLHPGEEPEVSLFRWLGVQAVQAAKAIEEGMAGEEAGPALQIVMRDTVRLILGVNL